MKKTNNPNNFKYTIPIPVPLGERVWTFRTDCCDACHFQQRENKVIACSRNSPCHTKKYSIEPVTVKYENLRDIVENWEKFYFYTSREAEEAGNKLVAANIKKMRELGYAVDENGCANHILTLTEAVMYNMKFKENEK